MNLLVKQFNSRSDTTPTQKNILSAGVNELRVVAYEYFQV